LTQLSPENFNTLSTYVAEVARSLFVAVLASVYTRMMWASVKRGNGIDLDFIVTPPSSWYEAVVRVPKGGSRLMYLQLAVLMIVASYSHTVANKFLRFKVVEVGANQVRVVVTLVKPVWLERILSFQ
jgi:hypothetical protein